MCKVLDSPIWFAEPDFNPATCPPSQSQVRINQHCSIKEGSAINLDAYDLLQRGFANFHEWTRVGNEEALRLFYRAIELDPDFSAYAAAAKVLYPTQGVWLGHGPRAR